MNKPKSARPKKARKEASDISIEHVRCAWAMAKSNGYTSVDRFISNSILAREVHHQVEEHFHKKLDIESLNMAILNARKAGKL